MPVTADTRAAAEELVIRRGFIGDVWVFPAPRSEGKPWSRHHAYTLWKRAQAKARIPREKQVGIHAFGRKSVRSLESYVQSDPETVVSVVIEPRKLRSVSGLTETETIAQTTADGAG